MRELARVAARMGRTMRRVTNSATAADATNEAPLAQSSDDVSACRYAVSRSASMACVMPPPRMPSIIPVMLRMWRSSRNGARLAPATSAVTVATPATSRYDGTNRQNRLVRPRGGSRSDPGIICAALAPSLELVPDRADGGDHAVRAQRLQLAPEVRDVHVDHAVHAHEVVAPHPVQQLRPAEHPAGGRRQRVEQVELHGRHVRADALPLDRAGLRIDPEAAMLDRSRTVVFRAFPTPKHGPDARDQFAGTERLRDVVVRARLQAADPVV